MTLADGGAVAVVQAPRVHNHAVEAGVDLDDAVIEPAGRHGDRLAGGHVGKRPLFGCLPDADVVVNGMCAESHQVVELLQCVGEGRVGVGVVRAAAGHEVVPTADRGDPSHSVGDGRVRAETEAVWNGGLVQRLGVGRQRVIG